MILHKDKWLTGYIDGQLTEKQKITLETHLKSCAKCAHKLEELKNLKSVMLRFSETNKPGNFNSPFAMPLRQETLPHKVPVYDTMAYRLALAFFMNGFVLKLDSFSDTWIAILGFYALFHLVLYSVRKIVFTRRLGLV